MLVIGSFNLQNRYYLKKYNGKVNNTDTLLLLREFLARYNISILGVQELTFWSLKRLSKTLDKYQISGNFRYPLFVFRKYNEANNIISSEEIISTETYHLPFLPTLIPRILTISNINTKLGKITFMNTHLSLHNSKVQEKQLNYILDKIKKAPNPVILTGDFNMTINNKVLKKFINDMKKLNIERVPIKEKTFKTHKNNNSIDQVFISKKFEIVSHQVIKDKPFTNISDHYPILVTIK